MCIRDRIIGCKVCKVLRGVWRYVVRPSKNLFKTYGGEGAWAIVTGGSSGIGLAYAKQLAKVGFNLILVARDEIKLREKRNEILREVGKDTLEIQIVSFDFSKPYSQEYYSQLEKAIGEKSIAILVNNVGADYACEFTELGTKDVATMLNVNVNAVTYLTHMVIPAMKNRDKRSAVIGISTTGLKTNMPYFGLYTATKAYMSSLLQNLHYELKDKGIDFLICLTDNVSTPQNTMKSIWHEKPESVAKGHLRALGYDVKTTGTVRHLIAKWYMESCLSYSFRKWIGKGAREATLKHIRSSV
eukprot:TRINITY_DN10515_c0_g1_i3.p1 TRINITY_DN10515_c0_g1~~TRINITY_DN10515_c0_g1_i3.p1  ORF type:complete len:300 (+),score=86.32 TRINITY_DN10515_c0_g1_i3:73-972(+)